MLFAVAHLRACSLSKPIVIKTKQKLHRAILCFLVYILIKNILIFLENNDICHFLKTSRDNFCPTLNIFRKEIDNLLLFFINILKNVLIC